MESSTSENLFRKGRKMKKALLSICVVLPTLMTVQSTSATLIDNGGGLIYDTDQNITWLADPNAAFGSTFDAADGIVDGRLTWQNANDWAASLTIGGVTGWRLPQVDSQNDPGAIPCTANCTNTEFGHLFYTELGGTAQTNITLSGDPDLALFNTAGLTSQYWTSTPFINLDPGGLQGINAWTFGMTNGVGLPASPIGVTDPLILDDMEAGIYTDTALVDSRGAWAVHDGNIGVVPPTQFPWEIFMPAIFNGGNAKQSTP